MILHLLFISMILIDTSAKPKCTPLCHGNSVSYPFGFSDAYQIRLKFFRLWRYSCWEIHCPEFNQGSHTALVFQPRVTAYSKKSVNLIIKTSPSVHKMECCWEAVPHSTIYMCCLLVESIIISTYANVIQLEIIAWIVTLSIIWIMKSSWSSRFGRC